MGEPSRITAIPPLDGALSLCRTCRICGAVAQRLKYPNIGCCSTSCQNKATVDHSPETLMRRFWKKVNRSPGLGPWGDCWEWNGRVDGRGYGEIKVAGQYKKAHRVALFGPEGIKSKLFACHRCDNPRCVRSDHLFAGTAQDNIDDKVRKQRHANGAWRATPC